MAYSDGTLMALIRTNVTLPADLLEQIDAVAGPRGRSRYITETLADRVRRDRQRMAFEATAGIMVGRPGWMSPDETIAFVNALRDGPPDDDR